MRKLTKQQIKDRKEEISKNPIILDRLLIIKGDKNSYVSLRAFIEKYIHKWLMNFGHKPLFYTYNNPEELDNKFEIIALNDAETYLLLNLTYDNQYFKDVITQIKAHYNNSNTKDLLKMLGLRMDTYEVVTKVINDWCISNYISPSDRQSMANSLYNYQLVYLDLVKRHLQGAIEE